jgi:isopropylmalate/homocitrate/citramalate synthase
VRYLLTELSKSPIEPDKPVVGENCFAVESGIAVMFAKRLYDAGQPVGALPYLPELVGQRFKIILGKKSGIHSIDAKLSELKISVTEQQKELILAKVKELSLQKRSHITEKEFEDIVKTIVGSPS